MRVGFDVTELRPGAVGGVRTALCRLLEALRDHATVDLVALAPFAASVPEGVRLVRTGGPSSPRRWRKSDALARAAKGLDLFHSPVTAFPELPGVPVTVTVHELPHVVDPRLEGWWRTWRQKQWLQDAIRSARMIVVPSQATREQLRTVAPGHLRVRVIPNAGPAISEQPRRPRDRSLLFVGRLDRRKGVASLLKGARAHPGPVRLVGPQVPRRRRALERMAAREGPGRVEFLGVVSDEVLDDLYRRAGAVALVSESEGFGYPVLEALGRGTPVIVARHTGAAEIGGEIALQVNPKRPGAIARALARCEDPSFRERIEREGPKRAALFSAERTARAYQEMFRDALAG